MRDRRRVPSGPWQALAALSAALLLGCQSDLLSFASFNASESGSERAVAEELPLGSGSETDFTARKTAASGALRDCGRGARDAPGRSLRARRSRPAGPRDAARDTRRPPGREPCPNPTTAAPRDRTGHLPPAHRVQGIARPLRLRGRGRASQARGASEVASASCPDEAGPRAGCQHASRRPARDNPSGARARGALRSRDGDRPDRDRRCLSNRKPGTERRDALGAIRFDPLSRIEIPPNGAGSSLRLAGVSPNHRTQMGGGRHSPRHALAHPPTH